MPYQRELAAGVARRRVRRGALWLIRHAPGFWVYVWAYGVNSRPLLPGPQERICRKEFWHILALSFDLLSQHRPGFCPLRERYGALTYSKLVAHFDLSPWFLASHGFEPDENISRELLEAAWREMIWGNELMELI